jgi:plastocyanin
MRPRTISRPRMLVLLALAALVGAAAAVLPALAAGSSAPSEVKLEVAQNCNTPNWPCWNPKGSPEANVGFYEVAPFMIAQGGTISFEDNDSKAPTDVVWKSAAPSCIPAVPSTPETGWKSTCTFSTAGEYEFESQELFNDGTSNYTKYKVIVEGAATGTTPTTPTTPGGGGTTTSPTGPAGGSGPGAAPGSPLLGSASEAVELARAQHGSSVRGSLEISQAGVGGRLEVDLLASGASPAKAEHSPRVRVGRLVRSSLYAGTTSFTVPLNAKGKAALRRHRRLALTVKLTLTPLHGAAVTVTRGVVVHA